MLPRMDDDREASEFSHALYLARQVDREAAEAGLMGIEEATEALNHLSEQPVNWDDSLRR